VCPRALVRVAFPVRLGGYQRYWGVQVCLFLHTRELDMKRGIYICWLVYFAYVLIYDKQEPVLLLIHLTMFLQNSVLQKKWLLYQLFLLGTVRLYYLEK